VRSIGLGSGVLDDRPTVHLGLVPQLVEGTVGGPVRRNLGRRQPVSVHVPEQVVLRAGGGALGRRGGLCCNGHRPAPRTDPGRIPGPRYATPPVPYGPADVPHTHLQRIPERAHVASLRRQVSPATRNTDAGAVG